MIFHSFIRTLKDDVNDVVGWYRELIATRRIDVALFHVTLAGCIAFLPPWVAFISPHFMHVPMIIAMLAISIRLIIRSECRARFWMTVNQFGFHVALLLAIYIALHSLNYSLDMGQWAEPGLWRRELPFLAILFIYGYVFSSPHEAYRQGVLSLFRFGTYFGLVVFISILIYNYILLYLDNSVFNNFAHEIKGINRGLEILSICLLLLLATLHGQARNTVFVFILLTWGLSFFAVGVIQNRLEIVQIDSETVQFGLPISLGVYFIACFWPKIIHHIVFTVIATVFITAPWLYQYINGLAPKFAAIETHLILDRTAIWDASAQERRWNTPWFGRGD